MGGDQSGLPIGKGQVQLVHLVVLSEGVLDLLSGEEVIGAEDLADVVEDLVKFSNWGTLNEVFADFHGCHFVYNYKDILTQTLLITKIGRGFGVLGFWGFSGRCSLV